MTTHLQLEQEYFEWLTSQISIPNEKSYNELFDRMFHTEFAWTVPNDDNRVGDALELRREWVNSKGRKAKGSESLEILSGRVVSILEVLIALSRRLAWVAGGDSRSWAWQLIENLTLERSFDPLTRGKRRRIEEVLERLIWRTYQRDGFGGFFPLNDPPKDQTKVEIWYQMNTYVNEIDGI